jgi:hypothetical protein
MVKISSINGVWHTIANKSKNVAHAKIYWNFYWKSAP